MVFCKMLQILVVCSNNAECLLLVEAFQHCFGYRSANLGFRTATELVDKDRLRSLQFFIIIFILVRCEE